MEIEFRVAVPDDAESVQQVARSSWHAAHAPIIGKNAVEELLDEWYDRERLEKSIAHKDAVMFLATDTDEVVGFAQGGLSEDGPADAAVGAIYVLPEYWGEGIGTELLDRLFDTFQTDGLNSAWLTVMADNDVGRSFYDKYGFEIHEERTIELAGQEVDDVVLVRDL